MFGQFVKNFKIFFCLLNFRAISIKVHINALCNTQINNKNNNPSLRHTSKYFGLFQSVLEQYYIANRSFVSLLKRHAPKISRSSLWELIYFRTYSCSTWLRNFGKGTTWFAINFTTVQGFLRLHLSRYLRIQLYGGQFTCCIWIIERIL